MIARLVVAAPMASFVVLLGCAGNKAVPSRPPVPPMGETAAAPAKDGYLADVMAAVAGQLECPLEEINVTCIRRDTQGECIAARGDGCERTVEYQFGDG